MDSFDDIKRKLEASIIEYNTKPIEDFEGLSPADMRYVLYEPYSNDSPLKINKSIDDKVLDQIPLFNQIEYLLHILITAGEIKLTSTSSLPTKIVKDIYSQGFLHDFAVDEGITKLYAETSCNTIHLTHILVELAGFTRKKNGKLSLTKNWGERIKSKDRNSLFHKTFETFTQQFYWGYFDGYQGQQTGQFGFAFSLLLLSKYGNTEREDRFYSEKYLKAFPDILMEYPDENVTIEPNRQFHRCYSVRTFERFLEHFNLVESRFEGKSRFGSKTFLKKSTIYDSIISFDI